MQRAIPRATPSFVLTAAILLAASSPASAAINPFIAYFNSTNEVPITSTLIAGPTGELFASARNGGPTGQGELVKIDPVAHTITSLGVFDNSTGIYPSDLLLDSQGNLYGTTNAGGIEDGGTLFRWNASSQTITPVIIFAPGDPRLPMGGLTLGGDGNYYGTTHDSAFKFSPATQTLSHLAFFNTTNLILPNSTMIVDKQGNLVGAAAVGGDHGSGGIFKFNPVTNALATFASLNHSTTGSEPRSPLTRDSAGNIYGVAPFGGSAGVGTLFKISADTGALTVEHNFTTDDAANPRGPLFLDANGDLLGMTDGGNHGPSIFLYSPATHNFQVIASFFLIDGLLEDTNGNFYGLTSHGGANGFGGIFLITLPEPASLALLAASAFPLLLRRRQRA